MKIEIGESLVYSWLRHVKKCQIVQTNWKSSPKWDTHKESCAKIIKLTNSYFDTKGLDVFGENSLDQLIGQAEIDAIGVTDNHMANGIKYFFVDVAFHEDGLNYGNNKMDTITRVLKKFIRAYLIYLSFFNVNNPCSILFVSPKVSENNILRPLREHLDNVSKLMNDAGYNTEFSLIVNEEFQEHIIQPTIETANDVADSNELFLRSYQLLKLFPDCSTPIKLRVDKIRYKMKNTASIRNTQEFRKINRIYRWAEHPEQQNHKIIKAFLHLEKTEKNVLLKNLEGLCSQKESVYYVEKFMGNFNSMKTDEGSSHGKVFFVETGYVRMYDKVHEVVNDCFL